MVTFFLWSFHHTANFIPSQNTTINSTINITITKKISEIIELHFCKKKKYTYFFNLPFVWSKELQLAKILLKEKTVAVLPFHSTFKQIKNPKGIYVLKKLNSL